MVMAVLLIEVWILLRLTRLSDILSGCYPNRSSYHLYVAGIQKDRNL